MKKRIIGLFVAVVACVGFCLGLAGCGKNKTAKQEVYAGEIKFSETNTVSVILTLDDYGTFTLMGENGAMLPLGSWGMPIYGLGGVYVKSGTGYSFKQLDGEEIATATLTESALLIDYSGISISLNKSEKSVPIDKLYGTYKGYVNDDGTFELRMIIRGDNEWVLIEEDGDIHEYGKYTLEGNSITAYCHDEPTEICAFGTAEDHFLSLDVEGDAIRFQHVEQ